MAMNLNPIASQATTQVYQNNQGEAPLGRQPDTSRDSTANAATQVDISQRARELQAQRLQNKQEAGEAERTADNEQSEKSPKVVQQETRSTGNQTRADAAGTQSGINVVA